MCGIVGVAGDLQIKHDKVLKHLLILDSLRGIDSTGVGFVSKTGDVDMVKTPGDPFVLMEMKVFDKRCGRANKVAIGHNRYATTGTITRKNAHPFDFDSLIGVHNGTLMNQHILEDSKNFSVDSETLYHHMNLHGVDRTIPILQGAWSLVWWDKYTEELCFLRNKERPMWIARGKKDSSIVWASEPWMLDVACDRNDLDIEDPVPTKIDYLHRFHIDGAGKIEEREGREISGAAPFVYHSQHYRGRSWPDTTHSTLGTKPDNVSVTPTGKVVSFPAKTGEQVDPKVQIGNKYGNQFLENYAGEKKVVFDCVSSGIDASGGHFVTLFDPENPSLNVRLYLHVRDNKDTYIGRKVIGDVSKFFWNEKNQYGYYKLDYGTHRLDNIVADFPDADGNLITEAAWLSKHGECVWCTQAVFPQDKFEFVKCNGKHEILCGDCAKDSEVREYVA